MDDSLFTKIIKGEIPSHKVYEDNDTFAFLDIHPIQPGHVLVVPKLQREFVWDLDEEIYVALMKTVKKIALKQKEVLGVPYIGEIVMGTDVPHAHVHVVPFTTPEELRSVADMSVEPDHTILAAMAERLRIDE